MAATKYVVLVAAVDEETEERNPAWSILNTVDATSSESAVRAAAKGSPNAAVYVAIPQSSFRPVKVTPEQTIRLVFEDAS